MIPHGYKIVIRPSLTPATRENTLMKIFISYRRAEDNDTYIVGNIRKPLVEAFPNEVFRDTYDIPGGADWRAVLKGEIESCRVMLVIIGPDWANLKNANGQKRLEDPEDVTAWEVKTGLERSAEGEATVIPVLVLGAQVPRGGDLPEHIRPLLNKNLAVIRNYPDFDRDMEKLIQDIRTSVGFAVDDLEIDESFEPRTVYIAKGPFLMGSPPEDETPSTIPRHKVDLSAFRIGIAPVTNAQYAVFVKETGTRALPILGWVGQVPPKDRLDHPVAGLTFREARDYCAWLSRKTNREYLIPNEAQWEKACRAGSGASRYPWGNEIDPGRSNRGNASLAPVDAYPPQNDFGLLDLVGNVRQWTCSLWGGSRVKPEIFGYPWKNDRRNDVNAGSDILRVVRGCSFAEQEVDLRCTSRKGQLPGDAGWAGAGIGFRVAMKV